jgi:hypothetical protein
MKIQINSKKWTTVFIAVLFIFPTILSAQETTPVTVKTVARAETDFAIKQMYDLAGGFGKLFHLRTPTPIDMQKIIRMNRDALYSSLVFDLSKPATIIMPETNGRYQSLHVINQDHYSIAVTTPGKYELTQEIFETKYVYIIIRTFIDANDPEDIKQANQLQDEIKVEGGGNDPLDLPNWNMEQLEQARAALNTLASLGLTNDGAFGTPEQVDPVNFLIFSAVGWGGLPNQNTMAFSGTVEKNDGTPYSVTAKDVPVDAFWSIIVYDEKGFIPENEMKTYSFNNVTAKPNEDGSITINFGGCEDGRVNCIPVSEGWNYTVRMYEPREAVINGIYKFPEIIEVR